MVHYNIDPGILRFVYEEPFYSAVRGRLASLSSSKVVGVESNGLFLVNFYIFLTENDIPEVPVVLDVCYKDGNAGMFDLFSGIAKKESMIRGEFTSVEGCIDELVTSDHRIGGDTIEKERFLLSIAPTVAAQMRVVLERYTKPRIS